MEQIKEAGHVESEWTTLSGGVRLDYKSWTVSPEIAEDGNSLQDKQWTPKGAGPMVPEEEDSHNQNSLIPSLAHLLYELNGLGFIWGWGLNRRLGAW